MGAHLNDLIDKAHMSDWVPLLHQDLLQMLHLENERKEIVIHYSSAVLNASVCSAGGVT